MHDVPSTGIGTVGSALPTLSTLLISATPFTTNAVRSLTNTPLSRA